MAYRVEFRPRAEHDLETVFRHLIQEAPLRGPQWVNGLEDAIHSLRKMPERHPVVRQFSRPAVAVRQLLYGRYPHVYKVYYTIESHSLDSPHTLRCTPRSEASRTLRVRAEVRAWKEDEVTKRKPTAGQRMIESARQALAFAKGQENHGCEVHVPDEIDVKAIRRARPASSQRPCSRLLDCNRA